MMEEERAMSIETISALYAAGCIQFGQFEIKRDFISPFQVDLTRLISRPELAKALCKALWEKGRKFDFDLLCGVPSLGAMFAGFISWEYEFPMVMKRLDGREGIQILGNFKSGQKCLVIQDVLISGQNTLSLIDALESEGLTVVDTLALIDLQIGGKKKIKSRGYMFHTVFGMGEIIDALSEKGKLSGNQVKLAIDFLESIAESQSETKKRKI